jgi:hypothetical protein
LRVSQQVLQRYVVINLLTYMYSFYMLSGRQIGRDTTLDYDPCAAAFFTEGEYLVMGGSDKKVLVCTFLCPTVDPQPSPGVVVHTRGCAPAHNQRAGGLGVGVCRAAQAKLCRHCVSGRHHCPVPAYFQHGTRPLQRALRFPPRDDRCRHPRSHFAHRKPHQVPRARQGFNS